MKKTMKAAVVHEFGKPLVIEEVPIPVPGDGQILVKVEACGVCHTDLHAANGDWPVKPNPPFIPGHEGVGYVVKVGPNVKHIKEGDRVGVPWLYSACGHCEYCLDAWETLCLKQENTGYSVNGSFAEYVVADADYVGILPDNVGFVEIAPVLCAGVTVYKGLKMTDTKPGDWVVISGIGGLGHMAVQYAKAMGLNVAAVDIDDAKLDLAKRLGASVTVNAAKTDPAAALPERNRRGSWCAGDSRFSKSIRAGFGNGSQKRYRFTGGTATGRFPFADLQSGIEWYYRSRVNRWNTSGFAGIAPVCQRRQGSCHRCHGQA